MRGCYEAKVWVIVLILAGALLVAWPTAAPAAHTAEGFCQSWLILGQYNQPGGAGPGTTLMRRDFLTDGASITEASFIPTNGMVVNTNYGVAASTGFTPGTQPYVVPTVFTWTAPAELVDYNAVFGDQSDVMAYAFTYATNTTGAPMQTYVGVSSDDSIQVLINGVEVNAVSIPRGYGGVNNVQNSWPATLRPGVNLVTVKVFEGGGGFGFRFRLQTANVTGAGTAATAQPNVTYDTNPAGYTYPTNVATATRSIVGVGLYNAGEPTSVTVTANKARGTPSPVVVETPPTGWTISNLSASQGTTAQAGGQITWTVGSMSLDTAVMTYRMTPAALAGDQSCNGTITSDLSLGIYGDSTLLALNPLGIFDWHGNTGLPPLGQPGGDPSTAGGASLAAGVYTLTGSGTDVWGTVDRCHLIAKRMTGSFYVDAFVNFTAPGGEEWATAAIIVKSHIQASAANCALAMRNPVFNTGNDIMGFEWREFDYGDMGGTNTEDVITNPRWMRLVRQGTTVRGYFLNDSTVWVEQSESPHVIPDLDNPDVLAGFFVTSTANGTDVTAQFSNVIANPLPVASASRDLPTSYAAGTPVPVALSIVWQSNSPLTIEETLPAGWTASNISDGGTQTGRIVRWTLASFTADKQLSYSVTAPAGTVLGTFSGFVRDQLAIDTPVGGETTVFAAGTTTFQNGRLPTPTYGGGADAHIMIWGPTAGQAGQTNNGASYFLEEGDWSGSGQTAANTDGKIPLLSFGLHGDIPPGSTVEQAVLRIYHFQSRQPCQADQRLYASRLLKGWSEGAGGDQDGRIALPGEVNWWWARQGLSRWESGGARGVSDMAAPESSAIVSQATLNSWIEWDVTQMTRLWVERPFENYGLKLAQDPAVATSATMWIRGLPGFYSGDYVDNPDLRPMLVVQWTPAPPSLAVRRWELYE